MNRPLWVGGLGACLPACPPAWCMGMSKVGPRKVEECKAGGGEDGAVAGWRRGSMQTTKVEREGRCGLVGSYTCVSACCKCDPSGPFGIQIPGTIGPSQQATNPGERGSVDHATRLGAAIS